ncbi:MAG: 5-(carboxyamino)imidazole ribonucleotide synthase [Planctomycetota bacterium]|nr:5-(carboxyamino)imidazole ribonucleotide synthase [Planctomycetota bacterium]
MRNTLVAVLGGGQLGRMLALAGVPMGVRFRFLDPDPACPARDVGELIVGAYDDEAALARLVRGATVATVEFENVPASAARALAGRVPFFPGEAALAAAQERLSEKVLLQSLGIPTPRFAAVETRPGLDAAARYCGLPAVLKTRRLGYDGKGQFVIRDAAGVQEAWDVLGGVPLILEQFVPFDREVSIIAVRAADGATAFYPLTQNRHARGILRESIAPAPSITPRLQEQAESYARLVLARLSYVGVLAIEFFEQGGTLIANEMACRVHNSGHWTIEGASCSQFENHVRAVLGLPLGSTAALGHACMLNVIGAEPDERAILAVPGARLHMYGKEPRPWRKLGHVTIVGADAAGAERGRAAMLPAIHAAD